MTTSLTLDYARRSDGTFVLTAAGEIDMSNIKDFNHVLATAITESAGSATTLTVDLSAVTYVDSTAITALINRANQINIIAHPDLIDVLTVSGLAELITVKSAPSTTEH